MIEADEDGAAMIETALVMPLLVLVIVGGLILGLAQVQTVRLERTAQMAADLWARGEMTQEEAETYAADNGATVVCAGPGETCYPSGITADRVQLVVEGTTLQYPGGSVTPRARVTALVTP